MKTYKDRIQYKNIKITYENCNEIALKNIKTFFIELFTNGAYKSNEIDFLLVSKYKQDNSIIILLILKKPPNFTTIKKFIYNEKEPIFNISTAPQTFINEIKTDNDYEYLEHGNFLSSNEKQYNNTEKEEKKAYHSYMDILREQWQADPNMTVEQIRKQLFSFLDKTNNSMRYTSTSLIEKNIKTYFVRNITSDIDTLDIKTFKDVYEIQVMKNLILQELKKLREKGRCNSIVIEGRTLIGKTEFIMSFLKSIGVKFNIMKRKFNFSRKHYFDECEVDVCDDFKIWNIKDDDHLETMCSCSQKNTMIDKTRKWEEERTLTKNHLVIFLCNPHTSFEVNIEKIKAPGVKEYLFSNMRFYTINPAIGELYKEDDAI